MSQPIIKQGLQGKYYEVDGMKYTATFPYEWAIDHKWNREIADCGSGPKNCLNCQGKGCIKDVFVFYCANCVKYIYNDTDYPKRNNYIYYAELLKTNEELWEEAPYMQGIPLSEIGDKANDNRDDDEEVRPAYTDQEKCERYWAERERYWTALYYERGGDEMNLEEPEE